MAGYTRTDTTNNIADGNIINATDLDNEFDGIQAAFNSSTGHNHDGTTGEGAPILVLGPTQDVVVGAAAITPKTTNTVDLGSGSLKFKDLFLAGNGSIGGTLAVTGVATLTAQPVLSSLTASRAVFTDGSKGLVSNAITGTGNVVMSTSPTLTGTVGGENATLSGTLGVTGVATFTAQPIVSSLTASRAVFSDGSKGLVSNAITGTGNVVMSAAPTLTGTITAEALTLSGATTLSGGTANGVAYLNGSKVLTTGSALTFTGSVLGVNNAGDSDFKLTTTTTGTGATDGLLLRINGTGSEAYLWNWEPSSALIFGANAAEQMRLTSTGLGIGTSSPASKLQVTAASADYFTPQLIIGEASVATGKQLHVGYNTTANTGYIQAVHNGTGYKDLILQPNGGNLGLGVTPSAWSFTGVSFDIAGNGSLFGGSTLRTAGVYLGSNVYYTSSGDAFRYKVSSQEATLYESAVGRHIWSTAPSGTAGDAISFTQALTLTSDGNLVAGNTTTSFRINATVASGADRDIFGAQISGASNGFTVKWNHSTTTTRVNIQNLPTSSAGLAAGDLYVLAGALMVA